MLNNLSVYRMIDAIVDAYDLVLPDGYKRRDPKEPNRVIKEAWEDELFKIFRLRFDNQAVMIEAALRANPLKVGPRIPIADPESTELLLQAFAGMMDSGYQQFMLQSDIILNYAQYTEDALFWTDLWVTELTDLIDTTTGKRLERELASFIQEEGYTIGDVVEGLQASGLDSGRAWDIAVSEVTRTFGRSEFAAGQQLLAENPNVRVIKTWFTNNDGAVCEICQPLHEVSVLINDLFPDGSEHPPAHPKNCRCWMDSTTDILGSVQLTEPGAIEEQLEIPGFGDLAGGRDQLPPGWGDPNNPLLGPLLEGS